MAQDLRQGGLLLLDANMAPGSLRWLPLAAAPMWDILHMGILPAYRDQPLSQHLLPALLAHA